MTELMEAALLYIDRGWQIGAAEPGGKRPLGPWRHEPLSAAEARNRFGVGCCNVFIHTGRNSGLVVVDVDGDDGRAYADKQFPPTGRIVRTPSGGDHRYYAYPPHDVVGNRVRLAGVACDIRGEGGLVIAPPSIVGGKKYEWIAEGPMPVFDVRLLPAPNSFQRNGQYPHISDREQLRVRARQHVARYRSIAGQGGDLACFKAACALVQYFALSREEAIEEMRIWNSLFARPMWAEARLIYKVDEAIRCNHANQR